MSTNQSSTTGNKKANNNNNPTFLADGIPVLIYVSKTELEAMSMLAKLLRKNFQAQGQKFLKTTDIREFVKFATLTYYNMVVLKIREEEKQRVKQQQQSTAQQQQQQDNSNEVSTTEYM